MKPIEIKCNMCSIREALPPSHRRIMLAKIPYGFEPNIEKQVCEECLLIILFQVSEYMDYLVSCGYQDLPKGAVSDFYEFLNNKKKISGQAAS